MKPTRRHYALLWFTAIMLTGVAVFLLSCMGDNNAIEVTQFNAKPDTFDSGLYDNICKIPEEKMITYQTKILIHGSYPIEKHLQKHPLDIAMEINGGNNDPSVIILTNDDPTRTNYLIKD